MRAREEVVKLQKKHDAFLKKNKLGRKSSEAALAAFRDKSVSNLSSLVILAEMKGKKVLLTGDARGEKILKGLKLQGHMSKGGAMNIDVLKIQHHGSDRNISARFLKRVIADHYVFCGDGTHGNPERKTLEILFRARPDGGFTLHFSDNIDAIDKVRRKEHLKKNGNWVAKRHSVAALLEAKKNAGVSFGMNSPGKADHISLALS